MNQKLAAARNPYNCADKALLILIGISGLTFTSCALAVLAFPL